MNTDWYIYLLWLAAACLLGWLVAFVFAGLLRLQRNIFLIPYIGLVGVFVALYLRWSQVDLGNFILHYWLWGVIAAILLGIFMVKNILSQPASSPSTGVQLGIDLLWQGVIYGAVDALFLSILPVMATWQAFSQLGWTADWPGKIVVGALALLASLLVTFAYHWGYPEYRGKQIMAPLIGNGMMSLGCLLTANPIAALGSHIAMHIAGVLHGPETTAQLPPHYGSEPVTSGFHQQSRKPA